MTPEEMDQAAKQNVGPPTRHVAAGSKRARAPSDPRRSETAREFTSRPSRWHHGPAMAMRRTPQLASGHSRRIGRATFQPGEYGRVTEADGSDRWWVRSSLNGAWLALSHQRVVENDDGTITLLYLEWSSAPSRGDGTAENRDAACGTADAARHAVTERRAVVTRDDNARHAMLMRPRR